MKECRGSTGTAPLIEPRLHVEVSGQHHALAALPTALEAGWAPEPI